jgi:two-component system sensor histidine kinase DesK
MTAHPDSIGTPDCDPWRHGSTRRRILGAVFSLGWLAYPVSDLASDEPSIGHVALGGAGLAAFVAIYLAVLTRGLKLRWPGAHAAIVGLAAIAALLTVAERHTWAMLFVFVAAAAGLRLPPRHASIAIGSSTALAGVLIGVVDDDWDGAVGIAATTVAIGFMMMAFARLITANAALEDAREELARLAVADERARFARDLHDLLGHSLSVIALKAELAGKLLPGKQEEATQHIADVKRVARDSLTQVREAVSGYRRPTLAGELDGARLALEAAGIEARLDTPEATLPPDVEGVLAWTVREGTTNVIRHSGARSCRIAIHPGLAGASVEVEDDGDGANGDAAGHGLAGLRERAERLAGELEAGPRPGGGFRLRVTVPVER